ncbi:MAG: hypothetical protein ACR2LL_07675 [Nitrosopumilus sp.]
MSAINRQPKKPKTTTSKNSLLVVEGVIAIASVLLFAYLMWYVAPQENMERVEVVAVTEQDV